jgi:hypothetical protein
MCVSYIQHLLELKTRPRFCPVSYSLSMPKSNICGSGLKSGARYAPFFPTNIRLCRNFLPSANALAYLFIRVSYEIGLVPGSNVINVESLFQPILLSSCFSPRPIFIKLFDHNVWSIRKYMPLITSNNNLDKVRFIHSFLLKLHFK